MSVIFRAPLALQDFLATKAVGVNPSELSALVQPELSLYPFYLAQLEVRVISVVDLAAAALGDDIEAARVPPGELWLVQSMRCETTQGSVSTLTACECYVAPPGGAIVFTTPTHPQTNLASLNVLLTSSYEWGMKPLFCPPDFSFGVTATRWGAVGALTNFRMAYRVLSI